MDLYNVLRFVVLSPILLKQGWFSPILVRLAARRREHIRSYSCPSLTWTHGMIELWLNTDSVAYMHVLLVKICMTG